MIAVTSQAKASLYLSLQPRTTQGNNDRNPALLSVGTLDGVQEISQVLFVPGKAYEKEYQL
jgi:hypothetical protein